MYILMDKNKSHILSLGSRPMEAVLAFCDYLKGNDRYTRALSGDLEQMFERYIVDGTEKELYELVDQVSKYLLQASCTSRRTSLFRLRRIPRPPCRECQHWKGHGIYCEDGGNEQSALAPACSDWLPPHVPWEKVNASYPPKQLYENDLDKRIVAYLTDHEEPTSPEAIASHFPNVDPEITRSAIMHLWTNQKIEGIERDKNGIPAVFRAVK